MTQLRKWLLPALGIVALAWFVVGAWRFLCPLGACELGAVRMAVPLPAGTDDWRRVDFAYAQTNVIFGPERQVVTRQPGMGVTHGAARAAWSRICPHLGCTLEFTASSNDVAMRTGYRPDGQPCQAQLTNSADCATSGVAYIYCPCHQSVFAVQADATGGLAASVVQGPASEPPKKLEVEWVQPINQPMEAAPALP